MSTTPFYKQGSTITVNKKGTALKALVAELVSLDPMLSIHSVTKDTEDTYQVYLKIAGSQMGMYIYTATFSSGGDGAVCNYGGWDSAGTWKSGSFENWSGILVTGHQACVVSWGIGNCLRYCAFVSNYGVGGGFVYGIFNTQTYSDTVVCTAAFSFGSAAFPSIAAISAFPNVFYDPDVDKVEYISYGYIAPNKAMTLSGYDYTLCPFGYSGYTANKGFLNLRWGGEHKLYELYNGTTKITAQPGKTVMVNGKSIMSVGRVFYAE